jgi:Uma2 family endonuclease
MAMTAGKPPMEEKPFMMRPVLLPTPPPGGFTAKDLPRLIEVIDADFELLDGEVVMMAPATQWHDEAIDAIKFMLRPIAPEWAVVTTETGVNLGDSAPIPDVLVVSRDAVRADSLVFAAADVHLAVEVVSPGTRHKDRVLRPNQYSTAGIRCFWRVEKEDDAMVFYTFERLPEGGYAPTGVFHHRLKVEWPFPIDADIPEVTW